MDRPRLTALDGHNDPAFDAGYVYHVTNAERARQIAVDGVLRMHEPHEFTDQDVWPDQTTGPRVYFGETTNLYHFAPEEGEAALLRMKRPADIRRDGSTPDLYVARDVSASELEVLDARGQWMDLSALAHRVVDDGPSW